MKGEKTSSLVSESHDPRSDRPAGRPTIHNPRRPEDNCKTGETDIFVQFYFLLLHLTPHSIAPRTHPHKRKHEHDKNTNTRRHITQTQTQHKNATKGIHRETQAHGLHEPPQFREKLDLRLG